MTSVGVAVAVLDRSARQAPHLAVFSLDDQHAAAVEHGESLAQAARREVREETGLDVRLTRLVGLYSRPDWGSHSAVFAAVVTDGALARRARDAGGRVRRPGRAAVDPPVVVRATDPGRRRRRDGHGAYARRGARAEVRIELGPPPVVNDPAMAALVQAVACEVVGPERAIGAAPTMAADDVAGLLRRAPGCYFWVGTSNAERGLTYQHHHPRFDIDEAALPIAIDVLVGAVERYLGEAR